MACLGVDGAMDGDHAARLEPGKHAVLSPGDLGGGVGERLERSRSAGPQCRREAGFDDAPRHRAALTAQPYESDMHQPASKSGLSRATTHSSANARTVAW